MGYGTDFLFSGSGMIPQSNVHMYQAPLLSQLLHQIPRFNLTLHRTNNTFRIRDDVYLEVTTKEIELYEKQKPTTLIKLLLYILFSYVRKDIQFKKYLLLTLLQSLGILGSVPAALLIISLFGLLLYLMTRCCDRKPRTAHSITSLKVTLSVVTVLCCAAIGLGLYGNDDLHNGLLNVLNAGRKVDNLISSVKNQVMTLIIIKLCCSAVSSPSCVELICRQTASK